MFRKVTGADVNGSAIESDDTSKWGVTWKQVSDKMTAIDAAAPMKELRRQRDEKLAETDWTALSDVTMADNMKTYRQALRDLPASSGGYWPPQTLTGVFSPNVTSACDLKLRAFGYRESSGTHSVVYRGYNMIVQEIAG